MSGRLRSFLLAGLLAGLLDQTLKDWVRANLLPDQNLSLVGPVLTLTRITSSGTDFGPFAALPREAVAGILVLGLVLIAGLLWRGHSWDRLEGTALGLVLGGAVGNAVDRFYFGELLDFLRLDLGVLSLPPFNTADAMIVLGCALLLLDIVTSEVSEAATRGEVPPAAGDQSDAGRPS